MSFVPESFRMLGNVAGSLDWPGTREEFFSVSNNNCELSQVRFQVM